MQYRRSCGAASHSGYWSDTSDYLVRKYSMENAMNYVNGNFDAVHDIRNGVRK